MSMSLDHSTVTVISVTMWYNTTFVVGAIEKNQTQRPFYKARDIFTAAQRRQVLKYVAVFSVTLI